MVEALCTVQKVADPQGSSTEERQFSTHPPFPLGPRGCTLPFMLALPLPEGLLPEPARMMWRAGRQACQATSRIYKSRLELAAALMY